MNDKNKRAENYSSSIVNELLQGITKEEYEITEKKMQLAVRIADAIEAKGMQKQSFAKELGKQPSEISKWLSGTHNFTIETLLQIEKELGISLINWTEKQEVKTIHKWHVVILQQQTMPTIQYKTPINELDSFIGWRRRSSVVGQYSPVTITR